MAEADWLGAGRLAAMLRCLVLLVILTLVYAGPKLHARARRRPGDLIADDVEEETVKKYQTRLDDFGRWLGFRSLGNPT